MKFLESTDFFLRVTVYDFCHRITSIKLKFRLIPMFHIGEQQFYDLVKEKIIECDELIYEGIQGKKDYVLSNSRRKLCKKLDLVMQTDALKLQEVNIKLTHGDYTKEEAEAAWAKVSLKEKVIDKIANPIKRYALYRKMTRKKLGKYYMQSYADNFLAYGPRFDEPETTENYYMAEREQKVLDLILERIALESSEDKMIGILYGANHMHRISRNLIDRRGFHACHGTFLNVFNII